MSKQKAGENKKKNPPSKINQLKLLWFHFNRWTIFQATAKAAQLQLFSKQQRECECETCALAIFFWKSFEIANKKKNETRWREEMRWDSSPLIFPCVTWMENGYSMHLLLSRFSDFRKW